MTCFSTCSAKDAEQNAFHISLEKPCVSTNTSGAQGNSTFQITVNIGTSRIIIKCTACLVRSECKYSDDLQKVIPHAVFAPLQHNYSLHMPTTAARLDKPPLVSHTHQILRLSIPKETRWCMQQLETVISSSLCNIHLNDNITYCSTVGLIFLALRAEEPEASTRGRPVDEQTSENSVPTVAQLCFIKGQVDH